MNEINDDQVVNSDSDDFLDDETYFKKQSKYANFLESMDLEDAKSKKRIRKEVEAKIDNVEADYEKKPRKLNQAEKENYLPTIQEDGSIKVTRKQKIEKTEEKVSDVVEEPSEKGKKPLTKREQKEKRRQDRKNKKEEPEVDDIKLLEAESVPQNENISLSPNEEKALKEKTYNESITEIAVNCERIMENPNKGVTRRRNEISPLNAVISLLKSEDVRIRLVAMMSLLRVFNDILPNYPIHVATKEEKEGLVSREVRSVRQFEESLIVFYSGYVKTLVTAAELKEEEEKQEKQVAVRCMCDLLQNHYQFNLADVLCRGIVSFIGSK